MVRHHPSRIHHLLRLLGLRCDHHIEPGRRPPRERCSPRRQILHHPLHWPLHFDSRVPVWHGPHARLQRRDSHGGSICLHWDRLGLLHHLLLCSVRCDSCLLHQYARKYTHKLPLSSLSSMVFHWKISSFRNFPLGILVRAIQSLTLNHSNILLCSFLCRVN